MQKRLLIIGLDCIGPEVLDADSLAALPVLRRLASEGISGALKSTLPPITVPAWTSMLTGRDPGELGVYGFRNRRTYQYFDLVRASSAMVKYPRLWDSVGRAGGRSLVVGVPQTLPPPEIDGELVAGFEAEGSVGTATYPPELGIEIERITGRYIYDVESFRNRSRDELVHTVREMTNQHFDVMEHLMATRNWDFAMLCEIGPDRLHHCFWSSHDPSHPRYNPDSQYRTVIRDYYSLLDSRIGRLTRLAGKDCAVMIASDHGAQSMHGGVCVNEILIRAGWLTLKHVPTQETFLDAQMVDWSRTRAWAEGGYYARIFLNVDGREPQGQIRRGDYDMARRELVKLLENIDLPGGPVLTNEVIYPEMAYRSCRGLAPDLLVFLGGLHWRSLGSVGHKRIWQTGNDTGLDEANHARNGFYVFSGAGLRGSRNASILDVAPTSLSWMKLNVPRGLAGRNWLEEVQ